MQNRTIKLAIVGRPNVGKVRRVLICCVERDRLTVTVRCPQSTLLNRIVRRDRVLTGPEYEPLDLLEILQSTDTAFSVCCCSGLA